MVKKLAKIRAFVAIELPLELVRELKEIQHSLDKGWEGIKWVKPEKIHLTLKFLGYIENERVEEIASILRRAAGGIKPFTLSVGGIGWFPEEKNPRVLWVGLSGDGELKRLQKNMEGLLAAIGFEKEDRPFEPHLTLCRVKSRKAGKSLVEMVKNLKPNIGFDFRVDSFVLFSSVLRPTGAEYSELKRISLG